MSLSQTCFADVTYTSQSNILNPLHNADVPANKNPSDYIQISFTVADPLLENATCDISVSASAAANVSSWTVVDSLFGISLPDVDAPISLVPSPGGLAGAALEACDVNPTLSCFGGAIATDQFGNIEQWNLVADNPQTGPYLTFITYDNPYLGSQDGLGSVQNGANEVEFNDLDGPTGFWSGPIPVPAPLIGFGLPAFLTIVGVWFGAKLLELIRKHPAEAAG